MATPDLIVNIHMEHIENPAERIGRHIDASPTPFHAVEHAVGLLTASGGRHAATAANAASPGLWYSAVAGSLVAWNIGPSCNARSGMRIVGAHTDSPNLRLKPQPNRHSVGYCQLGVEVYGGALLNSWLDRDLGVAGRLAVRHSSSEVRECLVRIDEPLLRVPQLAIHLDRDVNQKGLTLNPQQHLSPIWGVDDNRGRDFMSLVATAAKVKLADIVGHELMMFDLAPACLVGADQSMLASARLDNLVSCFVAIESLIKTAQQADDASEHSDSTDTLENVRMVCLFDHEEVGSVSSTGAASPLLRHTLKLIAAGFDATADDVAASRASSLMLSADGAHATHPNYAERHDAQHRVVLNGGPVLKSNTNQRYATNALTGAAFQVACERAGVPMQRYVNRSDMPCGSTIGPIAAGQLGIGVVDAGCAQLAMHSAREVCGSSDIGWFLAALTQFFLNSFRSTI